MAERNADLERDLLPSPPADFLRHPAIRFQDTPVFSALQWLYLAAVLGDERVVLHTAGPVRPVSRTVNIVPIGLVENLVIDADLFISNWALN